MTPDPPATARDDPRPDTRLRPAGLRHRAPAAACRAGAVRGARARRSRCSRRRAEEAGIAQHRARCRTSCRCCSRTRSTSPTRRPSSRRASWGRMLQWLQHAVGRRREQRGRRGREGCRRLDRAPVGRRAHGARDQRLVGQVLVPQPHARRFGAEEAPLPPRGGLALREGQCRPHRVLARPDQGAEQRRARRPHFNAENFGRPGATHALTDEPLRIADVSRMAAMRKKMADGSATPERDRRLRAGGRSARPSKGASAMLKLADAILDHRHEPMHDRRHVGAVHDADRARARARHRRRRVPPADHRQRRRRRQGRRRCRRTTRSRSTRFFGKVIRPGAYGMTELAQVMPRCEAGRYHRAPGLIWLILDRDGERLLTRGRRRGRRGRRPLRLPRPAVRGPLGRAHHRRQGDGGLQAALPLRAPRPDAVRQHHALRAGRARTTTSAAPAPIDAYIRGAIDA